MSFPINATASDYMAALSSLVLLRTGCDAFPVDSRNLLLHMAKVEHSQERRGILRSEAGYTAFLPLSPRPDRVDYAELILSILLDRMNRPFKSDGERSLMVSVFACHLLCPRPLLRVLNRRRIPVSYLEDCLGLPQRCIHALQYAPSCFVPQELNAALVSAYSRLSLPVPGESGTHSVPLWHYLEGYEDDTIRLARRPVLKLRRLQEAVDQSVPEHVLTQGHPASLWIDYTPDFSLFYQQFGSLSLETLYRHLFGQTPPLPLFGGRPAPSSLNYEEQMDRYLSRESSARLAIANLLYQRHYHPEESDLLSTSIRSLFEIKEGDNK